MAFVQEGQADSSQARSASAGLQLDIWRFGEGDSGDLCPEGGYRDQPRVSTLGTLKINEFVPKGERLT
jgi:hypothetical protein